MQDFVHQQYLHCTLKPKMPISPKRPQQWVPISKSWSHCSWLNEGFFMHYHHLYKQLEPETNPGNLMYSNPKPPVSSISQGYLADQGATPLSLCQVLAATPRPDCALSWLVSLRFRVSLGLKCSGISVEVSGLCFQGMCIISKHCFAE